MDGIVHLIPLPEDKIEEARRKLRERSKKKGTRRQVGPVAGRLGADLHHLAARGCWIRESANNCYRVRWQVELVIKRLKEPAEYRFAARPRGSLLSESTCTASCCTRSRLGKAATAAARPDGW